MGFRFRQSFGSGPFRINLSPSGVGWSVGGKGFRYGQTARGRSYTSFSLPGTGMSYQTYYGGGGGRSRRYGTSARPSGCLIPIIITISGMLGMYLALQELM